MYLNWIIIDSCQLFPKNRGRRKKNKIITDYKSKIRLSLILPCMRKPRYLQTGANYHVTAKINRGEFALGVCRSLTSTISEF